MHTPSAPGFRAANEPLIQTRSDAGPAAALDEFLTVLVGTEWRQAMEQLLPGASAQMERDAATSAFLRKHHG